MLCVMARRLNHTPSVTITISTTPTIKAHLEQLAASGYFGRNAADTAERVLSSALLTPDSLLRAFEELRQRGVPPFLPANSSLGPRA